MTIDELRAMIRQLRYFYYKEKFDESWISTPLLEKALANIEPVFRERLYKFIGVRRKDWQYLVLAKKAGGDLKPGYGNAHDALVTSLIHLWRELRSFKEEAVAPLDKEKRRLTCPHCGGEVAITVKITNV